MHLMNISYVVHYLTCTNKLAIESHIKKKVLMRLTAMSEMIVNGPFLRDVESGRLNTAEVSQ